MKECRITQNDPEGQQNKPMENGSSECEPKRFVVPQHVLDGIHEAEKKASLRRKREAEEEPKVWHPIRATLIPGPIPFPRVGGL
jgi:hypothetical protein